MSIQTQEKCRDGKCVTGYGGEDKGRAVEGKQQYNSNNNSSRRIERLSERRKGEWPRRGNEGMRILAMEMLKLI